MEADDASTPEVAGTGDLDVERNEGFAVVRPHGDLDLGNARTRRSQLAELICEHPVVVVDLDSLDYMDSSGLGTLMMSFRLAAERGRRLAIVCTEPRFRRSFELRGLDTGIPLYSSVDDALAGGAGTPPD